jgi:hypothetical protein
MSEEQALVLENDVIGESSGRQNIEAPDLGQPSPRRNVLQVRNTLPVGSVARGHLLAVGREDQAGCVVFESDETGWAAVEFVDTGRLEILCEFGAHRTIDYSSACGAVVDLDCSHATSLDVQVLNAAGMGVKTAGLYVGGKKEAYGVRLPLARTAAGTILKGVLVSPGAVVWAESQGGGWTSVVKVQAWDSSITLRTGPNRSDIRFQVLSNGAPVEAAEVMLGIESFVAGRFRTGTEWWTMSASSGAEGVVEFQAVPWGQRAYRVRAEGRGTIWGDISGTEDVHRIAVDLHPEVDFSVRVLQSDGLPASVGEVMLEAGGRPVYIAAIPGSGELEVRKVAEGSYGCHYRRPGVREWVSLGPVDVQSEAEVCRLYLPQESEVVVEVNGKDVDRYRVSIAHPGIEMPNLEWRLVDGPAGTCAFGGLIPGREYTVEVWDDLAQFPIASDHFVAGASATIEFDVKDLPARVCTLKGKVVARNPRARNLVMRIERQPEAGAPGGLLMVVPSRDGLWKADGLPPGEYRVWVVWGGRDWLAYEGVLPVGSQIDCGTFRPQVGGALRVTVRATGLFADVSVKAARHGSSIDLVERDGQWHAEGLQPGNYVVFADGAVVSRAVTVMVVGEEIVTVPLEVDEGVPVNFVLKTGETQVPAGGVVEVLGGQSPTERVVIRRGRIVGPTSPPFSCLLAPGSYEAKWLSDSGAVGQHEFEVVAEHPRVVTVGGIR